MLNSGNRDNCGFSDEIVSYMYDEMGPAERVKFETHLVECTVCTDEFAEVANARFSVFEWHKEDFAHLATPEIVIHYEKTRVQQTPATASIGFAEYLRRLLSVGGMSPLMTAAAMVTLVFGAGLAAFIFLGSGGGASVVKNDDRKSEIAANTTTSTSAPVPDRDVTVETPVTAVTNSPTKVISVETAGKRSKRTVRLAQEVGGSRSNSYRIKTEPTVSRAPKLSNFDEPEDKSLRLTALFDQIDSL